MMDFTYYNVGSFIECYTCRLFTDKTPVPEQDGNELQWIDIKDTDFGDTDVFAGDGNILHCVLIAEGQRKGNLGK